MDLCIGMMYFEIPVLLSTCMEIIRLDLDLGGANEMFSHFLEQVFLEIFCRVIAERDFG